MVQRISKYLLIGVLLLFSIFIIGVGVFINVNSPLLNENAVFIVREGDSLNNIAINLESSGFIRWSRFFFFYSRVQGTEAHLKTGIYNIPANSTAVEIHDIIVKGKQELFRVTIPEGWTVRRIGTLLEKNEITEKEQFLKAVESDNILNEFQIPAESLEGYLFPDTYLFQKNYPAERIAKHMVENFFNSLNYVVPDYSSVTPNELHEKVILASIIEREYRDPDEASLMASVFYNRLEHGITLGSCATIVYILTEEKKKPHPNRLTYDDLDADSPYNTYKYQGLPPGPIASPGRVALKAVFYPDESDYFYFLLKDPQAGRHHFSRTYTEHNQAHTIYIKKQ